MADEVNLLQKYKYNVNLCRDAGLYDEHVISCSPESAMLAYVYADVLTCVEHIKTVVLGNRRQDLGIIVKFSIQYSLRYNRTTLALGLASVVVDGRFAWRLVGRDCWVR
jgi:hypothetical protein